MRQVFHLIRDFCVCRSLCIFDAFLSMGDPEIGVPEENSYEPLLDFMIFLVVRALIVYGPYYFLSADFHEWDQHNKKDGLEYSSLFVR